MWINSQKKPVKLYAEDLRILTWSKICLVLNKVKEGPNTLNRLQESELLSSIFPKYDIVMFVIDLKKKFSSCKVTRIAENFTWFTLWIPKMPNWSKWWKIVCRKKNIFLFWFCVQNQICLGVLSWREGSAEEMFFF